MAIEPASLSSGTVQPTASGHLEGRNIEQAPPQGVRQSGQDSSPPVPLQNRKVAAFVDSLRAIAQAMQALIVASLESNEIVGLGPNAGFQPDAEGVFRNGAGRTHGEELERIGGESGIRVHVFENVFGYSADMTLDGTSNLLEGFTTDDKDVATQRYFEWAKTNHPKNGGDPNVFAEVSRYHTLIMESWSR